MPFFGAHMSIAGGLHKAIEAAQSFEMDTFQMFTHSPSQWTVVGTTGDNWAGKPLPQEDIGTFRKALKKSKLKYPTAHDSYLINLASPDVILYRKSLAAFVDELERAEALGLSYLVTHPGAHVGSGDEAGLKRVAEAIDETHRRCPGFKVKILLEATAGQGSSLGHRFEHLAAILDMVDDSARLGICIDTCHILAAGYALWPEAAYDATFQEFDHIVGIKRIKLFHVNDSKKALGSRVDRHEHLGKGHVGIGPFERLVNDKRFAKLPMILETPKEEGDDKEMDRVNLALLRKLLSRKS